MTKQIGINKSISKDGRKWLTRWYVNGHHFKTTEHKTKREAKALTQPPETRHTR